MDSPFPCGSKPTLTKAPSATGSTNRTGPTGSSASIAPAPLPSGSCKDVGKDRGEARSRWRSAHSLTPLSGRGTGTFSELRPSLCGTDSLDAARPLHADDQTPAQKGGRHHGSTPHPARSRAGIGEDHIPRPSLPGPIETVSRPGLPKTLPTRSEPPAHDDRAQLRGADWRRMLAPRRGRHPVAPSTRRPGRRFGFPPGGSRSTPSRP